VGHGKDIIRELAGACMCLRRRFVRREIFSHVSVVINVKCTSATLLGMQIGMIWPATKRVVGAK
jgi:hypothetical protein